MLPISQALQIARERNADLVEVAPTAVPPVCRLLDYGRFKYEQTKREREARKNQKVVLLKEVRLRPKIDEHDISFKTKLVEKFLSEGDKVKITVIFRGRELAHPQLGKELLEKVASTLKGTAVVEKAPSMEGRNMTMILAGPSSKKSVQASSAPAQQATTQQSAAQRK